jgi:hypothetical protein
MGISRRRPGEKNLQNWKLRRLRGLKPKGRGHRAVELGVGGKNSGAGAANVTVQLTEYPVEEGFAAKPSEQLQKEVNWSLDVSQALNRATDYIVRCLTP